MPQQIINNGESGLDVRNKLNANFTELYTGKDAVTVNTYADLPPPASVPGQRYWVLTTTGIYLINRRQAGAYYSNGTVWTWLGDVPTTADQIGNVPSGAIVSTNVQAAINELDSDLTGALANLPTDIRSQVESMLLAGANITLTPSGSGPTRQLTIAASGGGGSGTVTSVNVSGGTTGLTFTGGPVTTNGTITAGGTLDLDNGGTGATTASDARTNLGAAASGAVGSSGLTMATARLLGRTTAATGAIEEISVGSGLNLAGGVLSATGGGSDPWTYVKLLANAVNSATSNINTDLRFVVPPDSLVIFEGMLFLQADAATTGPRPGITLPTGGVLDAIWEIAQSTGATAQGVRYAGNTSTRLDATAIATANVSWYGRVNGSIVTGPSVTGDLIITLASEIAASEARIMANSWIRWRTV